MFRRIGISFPFSFPFSLISVLVLVFVSVSLPALNPPRLMISESVTRCYTAFAIQRKRDPHTRAALKVCARP